MAEPVRAFKRLTSPGVGNATTGYVTALQLSAAELGAAGFQNNDDVFVFVWGLWGTATFIAALGRVQYGGVTLGAEQNWVPDAGENHNGTWMFRLDLATLADLNIQISSNNASQNAALNLGTVLVLPTSAFGTENTDWWWNENTTLTDLTTSFASFATKTFTPAAGDYVMIGREQTVIDTTGDSTALQMVLDTVPVYGPTLQEGENTQEEWSDLFFHVATLSAASHTVALQARVDAGVSNDHRSSQLLIFKRAVWPDLNVHLPGTVSIPGGTDTEIATITSTLSGEQDVVLIGNAVKVTDSGDQRGYMWVRSGGSTVIPPVANVAAGFGNWLSYDGTDLKNTVLVGYAEDLSGTLDLDLFLHDNDDSTLNATNCRFMVWGMNSTAVTNVPNAPANPFATTQSDSEILVGWDDVSDETGYRVERSADGSTGWTDVSGNLAADATSYSDTGLDCETQYFYRVFAFNGDGDSDPSTVVDDTTDTCPPTPSATRRVVPSVQARRRMGIR